MKLYKTVFVILAPFISAIVMAGEFSAELDSVIQGTHRDAANVARDVYRHPKETLMLFDMQSDMKVLEILPGRGWYTEILAPLLKDKGELIVASFGDTHPVEYLRNIHINFIKMMDASPDTYGSVKRVNFNKAGYLAEIPDNSMDMVVTFRNTHNWIRFGGVEEIYAAFNRVLKPGGILGVVQHRANAGSEPGASAEKGYVPESYLINMVEDVGFELVKKSDINENLTDSKDYPEGVWSLPPTYREKDKDRERYTAIGESDRMTMKFIKIK
ncbi:MAG: class I SAM-dependent methyltransferase [Proteobacteria bacterium]|nr:class I SAM-dependent methyltransferase [Pseudomonadota bacterium]